MALSTIPTRGLSEQGINFRNLIINGNMSIAQRGTSVSGITSTSYNTLDRYRTGVSGFGTWTQSQDTDVPTGQGFANSLKMDCTTASGPDAAGSVLYLVQYIEAQNLQQLKFGTSNAESTTISFWVKTNVTGTYTVEIVSSDSGRHICGTYTVNASNTWEKKTITFEGDTTGTINNDNGRGFEIFFWLGAGSEFTSGTLATSWATSSAGNRVSSSQANIATSTDNNFWITGIQLEAGTTASDFEFLPYDVNLQRCERYFEKYERDTTESHPLQCVAECDSAGRGECILYYKQKRTSPSITLTHTGAQWGRLNGGVNQYVTITGAITTAVGIGKKSAQIFATTGGTINTGEITFMRFTGTDKIEIDAEL